MTAMSVDDPILTNEAARILGVSPDTVRFLERTGRLPAVKIGRGVRLFDRAIVIRVARQRERRQAADGPR